MTVTVRFAPSPTGNLHIGNARTALFNWLFATKNSGRFIQRFDDTDQERSRREHADAILYDLHWLGIFQDATEYQSRRLEVYDGAFDHLRQAGLVYPCYETAEELDLRRKLRRTRGQPEIYGRESLALTHAQISEYQSDGRKPHWRFLLPNYASDPLETQPTEVTWTDLVRGEQVVDLAVVSDPVLVREDGTYLYTLPSVTDDIDMGITHVIRGEHHVTNTGVQIALFRALDSQPPESGHHNTLATAAGEGLSRQSDALSILSLRESGIEAGAVASLAVLTGTSDSITAEPTIRDLVGRFDLAATSQPDATFEPGDLIALNRTLLQNMPFAEARDRLAVLGITGRRAEPFWLAVRGNIDHLVDVAGWWKILQQGPQAEPELSEKDKDFVRDALDLLPPEPWDRGVWKAWTDQVKQQSTRKGKALFMPLRLALTGLASGPELADLLPLMGREEILARRP